MKYLIPSFILILFLSGFDDSKNIYIVSSKTEISGSSPTVIIELFTSQGCSSCPAADNLLNNVVTNAQKNNGNVIALSYHVTYWDHLGWRDPYSKEQFTERQKSYAQALESNVYTPQMVVNGTKEFVGSDSRQLSVAIENALHQIPLYRIEASVSIHEKEATINYTLDKESNGELLNIALVAPSVENDVLKGENKGLTLKHYNVVTKLETKKLKKSDTVKISIQQTDKSTAGMFIVLYAQNPTTLKILGAIQIKSAL